jgi:hypothetical protein
MFLVKKHCHFDEKNMCVADINQSRANLSNQKMSELTAQDYSEILRDMTDALKEVPWRFSIFIIISVR